VEPDLQRVDRLLVHQDEARARRHTALEALDQSAVVAERGCLGFCFRPQVFRHQGQIASRVEQVGASVAKLLSADRIEVNAVPPRIGHGCLLEKLPMGERTLPDYSPMWGRPQTKYAPAPQDYWNGRSQINSAFGCCAHFLGKETGADLTS